MRIFAAITISAVALYASTSARAGNDNDTKVFSCEHAAVQTTEPLSAIEQQAIETDYTICKTFFSRRDPANAEIIDAAFADFGSFAKQKTLAAVGDRLPALRPQFDAFIVEISEGRHQSLPSLRLDSGDLPGAQCSTYFSGATAGVEKVKYSCDDKSACSGFNAGADATCQKAFTELANAVNIYKYSYTTLTSKDTEKQLIKMSADWDSFLAAARSQTLLDIAATSFFERGQLRKDHLVGPPDRAWMLLHPDVVYENLNTAPAGDKAKMGIAIEWIGVNFWRGDNALGIPIGIALASVYADRPDVDAVGHGLMLHLNNKYTLGWTHRDSGNGFYVTIDLLKAIQDNKQVLQQYKDRLFSH